ncbi:dihydrodipicolinate synthase family protein [bacterium]|nr:dihydrodipicolinate synthase family protein [bacterium]
MSIANRSSKRVHGRKIEGIAACLLPYEANGQIAKDAFQESVRRTEAAGLKCAVNMDTGYANYLTEEERNEVLRLTREALGPDKPFVAGVFVEGLEGDLVELYRNGADAIAEFGGTPILFQTTRFHDWAASEIVALYAEVCAPYESVLGFELGKMFAPNGMIYSEEVIAGLMGIPSLKGIKHSSLSRGEELKRLALRDELRPDFKIYTGNDLGIDMIEYGSDYLLGLAAFCPEKFAERDRMWEDGDERYFELNDALQYLGNVAFRPAVPAYKHSCAVFQHLLGRIPSSEPHPKCPRRPEWESEMLADCVKRLGYEI